MGDAVGDAGEEVIGDGLNGGGHGVAGIDRAEDAGPLIGALAVTDAGGLEVRHDGEILPDFALQSGVGKFLAQDCVRFTDGGEAVAGDGADAADAEAGAGEGLGSTMLSGRPRALPTTRTSSLNRRRMGSTSSKFSSGGRPPTL